MKKQPKYKVGDIVTLHKFDDRSPGFNEGRVRFTEIMNTFVGTTSIINGINISGYKVEGNSYTWVEESLLPRSWYVRVDRDNQDTLSKWRFKDCNSSNKLDIGSVTGIDNKGFGKEWNPAPGEFFDYEISFEQFKQQVLKEDKMEILKIGEKVVLHGISYTVTEFGLNCFYLNISDSRYGVNDVIFDELGFDNTQKQQWQKDVLGYTGGGIFPECKNLEDLTKFVNAIKNHKMEESKKLIGYKCPTDLYDGRVKKGEVFTIPNKDCNPERYHPGNTGYIMPKEIVETWEPVFSEEFKVGDWVVITKYGCGTSTDDIGLVCKLVSTTAVSPMSRTYTCEIDRDKKGNSDRYLSPACLRLATKKEIETATTETINMGGFNLTIRNNKVYYLTEDITDFVEGLVGFHRANFNMTFGSNSYKAVVHDIIFDKTGCQNSTTKLSDWKKVYDKLN